MRRIIALLIMSIILMVAALIWRLGPAPAAIAPELDLRANRSPVVLLLGGSEGGRFAASDPMAQELRDAGFHVARVAYFGAPGTPAKLDRIALDPFDALVAKLSARPDVFEQCVFIAGASKGAELALLLASGNDAVGAVSAVAPAHVVFQSPRVTPIRQSSWRRGRAPVAFVPFPLDLSTVRGVLSGNHFTEMYRRALENEEAVRLATIPVERIAGPVQLIGAAQDEVWPSAMMAQAAAARLEEQGFPHDIRVQIVDGGHYLLERAEIRGSVIEFLIGAAQRAGCLPPVMR